jgi:hypothetical protein
MCHFTMARVWISVYGNEANETLRLIPNIVLYCMPFHSLLYLMSWGRNSDFSMRIRCLGKQHHQEWCN